MKQLILLLALLLCSLGSSAQHYYYCSSITFGLDHMPGMYYYLYAPGAGAGVTSPSVTYSRQIVNNLYSESSLNLSTWATPFRFDGPEKGYFRFAVATGLKYYLKTWSVPVQDMIYCYNSGIYFSTQTFWLSEAEPRSFQSGKDRMQAYGFRLKLGGDFSLTERFHVDMSAGINYLRGMVTQPHIPDPETLVQALPFSTSISFGWRLGPVREEFPVHVKHKNQE